MTQHLRDLRLAGAARRFCLMLGVAALCVNCVPQAKQEPAPDPSQFYQQWVYVNGELWPMRSATVVQDTSAHLTSLTLTRASSADLRFVVSAVLSKPLAPGTFSLADSGLCATFTAPGQAVVAFEKFEMQIAQVRNGHISGTFSGEATLPDGTKKNLSEGHFDDVLVQQSTDRGTLIGTMSMDSDFGHWDALRASAIIRDSVLTVVGTGGPLETPSTYTITCLVKPGVIGDYAIGTRASTGGNYQDPLGHKHYFESGRLQIVWFQNGVISGYISDAVVVDIISGNKDAVRNGQFIQLQVNP